MSPTIKWNKLPFLLAIIALCCFMFAGAALADDAQLVVTPGESCAGAVTSYDLTVTGLNIDVNCDLCGHSTDAKDNSVEVLLPYEADPCRQFGILPMDPIPVDVQVYSDTNGLEWKFAEVKPIILPPNNSAPGKVSAKLYIQCGNLQVPANSFAKAIKIRNFQVTNPKSYDSCYQFVVQFNGTNPKISAKRCVVIDDTIGSVTIDKIDPLEVKANTDFIVTGTVKNLCGRLMPNIPVTVSVAGGSSKTVYTDGDSKIGTFIATLTAPQCVQNCNGDQVKVTAVVADSTFNGVKVCANPDSAKNTGTGTITVLGATPVGVTWQDLKDENDNDLSKLPRYEIWQDKTYKLTVTLHDSLCADGHQNMLCPGNPTEAPADVKVDLAAWQADASGVKQIVGKFFDPDQGMSNAIAFVKIPKGQCSKVVYFKATSATSVIGTINVEARASYYNSDIPEKLSNCTWTPYVMSTNGAFDLELTPLVTKQGYSCPCTTSEVSTDLFGGQFQRAGWPFQAAVWVDKTTCDGCKSDFDVRVELEPHSCDGNGIAKWDTSLTKAYDVVDTNASLKSTGDTYLQKATSEAQFAQGIVDHQPCKSHFYVYTSPNVYGVTVTVKLTCKDTGATWMKSVYIPLTTPVEMERKIASETWQVLSTPKYLEKKGVPFDPANSATWGTFADLMPADSYKVIYTYDTLYPTKWKLVNPTDPVEPLRAYFIRTAQFDQGEKSKTIKYYYARAVDPTAMIPSTRFIDRSWNALGVSVQGSWINDYKMTEQGDEPFRALGTVGKGCKLVYNPEKLGNTADTWTWNPLSISQTTAGSWVVDPGAIGVTPQFYNGDGYWLYMTDKQELAANAGLELFGNYRGTPYSTSAH